MPLRWNFGRGAITIAESGDLTGTFYFHPCDIIM